MKAIAHKQEVHSVQVFFAFPMVMAGPPLLQVTFSEKGTKNVPKIQIRKFEILHFSDNISKITMIQNFFVQTSVPHQSIGKNAQSN